MDKLKLDTQISQAIVDGTLNGYLEYLDERRNKKKSMNVSGAYAWTRGNHIDDQISKIFEEQGLEFKIEKAGYSWEYLQFTVNDESEEYMVIVKNAKRINNLFDGQPGKNKDNYLTEYSEVDRPFFQNKEILIQPEQIELELDSPEEFRAIIEGKPILNSTKSFSRFYIVTYEISDVSKMITSIQLTMPDVESMSLVCIEDLTYLIEQSKYDILPEDVDVIRQEISSDKTIFSGNEHSFGYAISAEEEKKVE